jgi:hypothetical protein
MKPPTAVMNSVARCFCAFSSGAIVESVSMSSTNGANALVPQQLHDLLDGRRFRWSF